jgi:nucleolar protein TMA23
MLDSSGYLKSYNWKEGEALQKGGIRKPILVKHKKDKKGIGHQVNGSADAWWERLFDGQLKGLDVTHGDGDSGVTFKQEKVVVASAVPVHESPLYRMFVRGETLKGTTGKVVLTKTVVEGKTLDVSQLKTGFDSGRREKSKGDKEPNNVTGKKEDKEKKGKKEKKEKKEKIEKIEKKAKKEKKSKKDKKAKEKKEKNLRKEKNQVDKEVKKAKKEKPEVKEKKEGKSKTKKDKTKKKGNTDESFKEPSKKRKFTEDKDLKEHKKKKASK